MAFDTKNTVHANGGRHFVGGYGLGLTPVIPGDTCSFNSEGTAGATETSVTLPSGAMPNNPNLPAGTRTLVVVATVAVFVSKKQGGTATAADRFYVPANVERQLPWYQDDVYFLQAGASGGQVYFEGRA